MSPVGVITSDSGYEVFTFTLFNASGTIYNSPRRSVNMYGDDVEVDYRGAEVTPENFVRLLTGRHPPGVPMSKRLLTTNGSNVLLYMTGHGGEGFLKFQDTEVLSNNELGNSLLQMWKRQRYHEILVIIETCHAESMLDQVRTPNIIGMASANRNEDSYSVDHSRELGLYLIDAFTGLLLSILEQLDNKSKMTLGELFNVANRPFQIRSHPVLKKGNLLHRKFNEILVSDFFGGVNSILPMTQVDNKSSINATAVPEYTADEISPLIWRRPETPHRPH